jgi:hypothetical protein
MRSILSAMLYVVEADWKGVHSPALRCLTKHAGPVASIRILTRTTHQTVGVTDLSRRARQLTTSSVLRARKLHTKCPRYNRSAQPSVSDFG